jgi:hypothetical protein
MAHSAAFFYVATAFQPVAGTATAPTKFSRAAAMSKGSANIKTEKLHDGLNREWAVDAKTSQYHEVAWTSQLYPDFFSAMLFHMYGITDSATGTQKSGGGNTTLSSSVSAGATSIPVTAITNFSSGDTVQVGSGTSGDTAELVVIGTPSGSALPVTTPTGGLRYGHATGLVVKSVVDPFTHTGTSTNAIPPLISFEHSIGQAPAPATPLEVVRTPDGVITDVKLESQGGKLATTQYAIQGRLGVPGQTAASVAFETDRPATLADAAFTFPPYVSTPGLGFDVATGDVSRVMMDGKLTADNVMLAGTLSPIPVATVRETAVEWDVFVPDNKLLREIWYGAPTNTIPITALQGGQVTAKWDLAGTPDHFVQITWNNLLAESATPTFDASGKAMILKCKGIATPSGSTGAITATVQNGFGLNYGWPGA